MPWISVTKEDWLAGRVSKYEEDCEAYRKAYIADCMVNRMMDSKMNSMMDDMLDNMLDEHKFNPKLLELAEKLQGRRLLLDEVRRLGIEIGLLSGRRMIGLTVSYSFLFCGDSFGWRPGCRRSVGRTNGWDGRGR